MERDHISLNYGRSTVRLGPLPGLKVKMLIPRQPPHFDLNSGLIEAIGHPVGTPALDEIAGGKSRITICVPDRTRPRIARYILPTIVERLEVSGSGCEINVLIANGSHCRHTDRDIVDVVGSEMVSRVKVSESLSQLEDEFVQVGTTSRGTPVWLNRLVVEADLVVVVSTVTTHYFAGWGGGRKMILPGVAALRTIWANHRLTLTSEGDLDERCASGRLEGNPVHEDMLEAASMVKNVFSINIVLNGEGKPAAVTAGSLEASHAAAVKIAAEIVTVPFSEPCDLAVASPGGYPFDIDFIQTHKSIDHVARCTRDGGVILMVAECSRGLGSETFLPWFDLEDRKVVAARLLEHYELNGHTALALMKKLEHRKIILVSSLSKSTVERMGMIWASSLEHGLDLAREILGEVKTTYVFPFAWGILPVG